MSGEKVWVVWYGKNVTRSRPFKVLILGTEYDHFWLLVDNVYIGIFSFSSSREVTQDQQVSFSFIFWLEMTKIEAKIWTWTWLIRIWSSILTKINFSKCLLRKQIHGYLKAFHWWKELKPFLCINLKLDELFQGISSR